MTSDDRDLRGTGRTPFRSVPDRDAATPSPHSAEALAGSEAATVILGRVGTWDEAARVRDALREDGFAEQDVEVFYTGPSGRHAVTPIGGDADADAGATQAGAGAATGGTAGAVAGLAVGAALAATPVVGPVVFTAAAVGAFGGALAGGVAATEDGSAQPDTAEHPVARPGGVVVAIRVDRDREAPGRALAALAAQGAIGIERSPGHWRDGSWIDWDPVAPREQIAPAPGTPQA
jgi:hypothetical protein